MVIHFQTWSPIWANTLSSRRTGLLWLMLIYLLPRFTAFHSVGLQKNKLKVFVTLVTARRSVIPVRVYLLSVPKVLSFEFPWWGTTDAENKVISAENQLLLWAYPLGRSEYCLACLAYCQKSCLSHFCHPVSFNFIFHNFLLILGVC